MSGYETGSRGSLAGNSGKDRGIALITVIVVLMALVIIATPFSISMRNHSESATDLLHRTRALKECEALRNIALERLKETHSAFDITTPLFDQATEWAVFLDDLGLGFKTSDPRGKIWSLVIHDLQGRVNLNTASIYLLANLLDLRTHLTGDMEDGMNSMKVLGTEFFQEAGVLWVEGEGIFYAAKSGTTFDELDPDLELPSMERNMHILHPSGTEVIGFSAFLIATYLYKWNPGWLSSFPTVESIRNISTYGEESVTRDALDRIMDRVTVHSGTPGGRPYVNPQRILKFGEDESSDALIVENGRYIGPGSIVRISMGELVHYSMVLRSRSLGGHAWTVLLQEPVPFDLDGDELGLIEVMARHPVNINTATVEVLVALLSGLELTEEGSNWIASLGEGSLDDGASGGDSGTGYIPMAGMGGGRRIRSADARTIAAEIKARPIQSFTELDERLKALMDSEVRPISNYQRWAVMLNAIHSNDAFIHGGTAPFCFASEGCFQIESAVSDNYESSGREKARQFCSDIVWPTPEGPLMATFITQRDFEDQRRLTREGRHYVTLPVNLSRPEAENLPPSLAPIIMDYGMGPSEDVEGAGIQLAPVRVAGPRCLHFDESDQPVFSSGVATLLPSQGSTNSFLAFESPMGFVTGESILFLDTMEEPVQILGGPYARVWPFSVDFWYRFDELDGEHFILDCGVEGRLENNRIYLFFDGKELVLRVADATMPTSTLNSDQPLEHAEIRYDFSDLPLEKGVFYHIACQVFGTKPSDLCLFVDGISRGKRTFQTRLTEPLSTAANLTGAPGARASRATIKVEDTSSFPDRGVLRIGQELVEYSGRTDKEFIADPLDTEPFGGRAVRSSQSTDHPETETVELYGYTCPLHSELIPMGETELGENLGRFWVAMVDPDGNDMDTEAIQIAPRQGDAGFGTSTVGTGFFCEDTDVKTLPLINLDQSNLSEEGQEAFSKSGGYAIIFSEFPYSYTLRFEKNNQKLNETYTLGPGDGSRAVTGTPKEDYLVNGFSVLHYDSFSGSSLQGISWPSVGQQGYPNGLPEALMKAASEAGGSDTGPAGGRGGAGGGQQTFNFLAKRCFVTEYVAGFFTGDPEQQGGGNQEERKDIREARVFVYPISVKVGAATGSLFEEYHSTPNNPGQTRTEIVQIGLDFTGSGEDDTEWIRYDSIEDDVFIRENPEEIARSWQYLADPARIDWNESITNEDAARVVNQQIRFRAQHGTPDSRHSSGSKVLPVFRVSISDPDPRKPLARPGRHDTITLVASDPDAEPEAGVINHCNSRGSRGEGGPYRDRDWGSVALIGLRSGIVGEYLRQDFDIGSLLGDIRDASKTGEGLGDALSTAWAIESRDVTRIIKFPSGELPNRIPDVFALGGSVTGEPSPSVGCIDEVRFKSLPTPNITEPELPKICRFVLEEELEEDEERTFMIFPDALQYNRQIMRHQLLEAFELLKSLPQDAGLLLVGDEIIGYTDVDWEEGIFTIASEGRGMFGTKPGYHGINEPVRLVNFAEVSILDSSISDDDSFIYLKDPEGFPFEGSVLIDQEVIGYTRLEGELLTMPEIGLSAYRSTGLLRGRFGTTPDKHPAGSMVYSFPVRHRDLYMPGTDEPEAAYFPLSISAPGGFYSRLSWKEELQGEGADLVVLARVGGRGDWRLAPSESPDLFFFEDAGNGSKENVLLRQGDRLDLRIFTRYAPGAFDSLDFASNAWKYAPVLKFLGIEYVQPTRIVRHEEWR